MRHGAEDDVFHPLLQGCFTEVLGLPGLDFACVALVLRCRHKEGVLNPLKSCGKGRGIVQIGLCEFSTLGLQLLHLRIRWVPGDGANGIALRELWVVEDKMCDRVTLVARGAEHCEEGLRHVVVLLLQLEWL